MLAIFAGDPPEAVTAEIAAVSFRKSRSRSAPTYVLSYFDDTGRDVAFTQHETMRAALDEGHREAGLERTAWATCRIEVPEDGRVGLDLLRKHLLDPRFGPVGEQGEGAR